MALDWTLAGLKAEDNLALRCEVLRKMQRDRLLMSSTGPDVNGQWKVWDYPAGWAWTLAADDARRSVDRPVAPGVLRDHAWYTNAPWVNGWTNNMACCSPWIWYRPGEYSIEKNRLGQPVDPDRYFVDPSSNTFISAWHDHMLGFSPARQPADYAQCRPFTPEWFEAFYAMLKQCGETVLAARCDWNYYGLTLVGANQFPDKKHRRIWDTGSVQSDAEYDWFNDDMQMGEWIRKESGGPTYTTWSHWAKCFALPLFRSGKGKTVEVWGIPRAYGTAFDNFGQANVINGQWSLLSSWYTIGDSSVSPFLIGPDGVDPRTKTIPALNVGETKGWATDEIAILIRHCDFEEYDS